MNDEISLTSTAKKLSFQARSGTREWTIQARSWGDLASAKARALIVHGLGAHSGWFEGFAHRLAERGIYCLSYDQIGFGGRRGETFHSKDEWLQDLVASWNYLKEQGSDTPIYLIGNSMGAVVAYASVEQVKPDAMVLFSPGFDGHPTTFSLGYKLRALLAAIFAPDSDVVLPYSVDDITPTQSIRDFLTADPDRRFTISARMGLELLKLTMSTRGNNQKVSCPVLMATAGIERIVDNNISEKLYKSLQAPIKKRLIYTDSMHDLMFDPNLDGIVIDVCDWLETVTTTKNNVIKTQ